MKRSTAALCYVLSFSAFIAVIWRVFNAGNSIKPIADNGQLPTANCQLPVAGCLTSPLPIFILQLILIIVLSRVCGYLFKKIGQPAVMGEIVAGIILGPSLMGAFLPAFSSFVFPAASLGNLQILSQVGLILFMFVIGMELELHVLKKKAAAAIFISYFSIIIPFGLGIGLSYFLYRQYAPADIPFYAFALFTGIAMSITAFPVLARIIRERGLTQSKPGTIAITAAAAGDVAAWCMLAFIVAVVKAGGLYSSLYTIIFSLAFVCVMLFIVRPLLKKFIGPKNGANDMKRSVIALVFIVLLFSAWCCEVMGIHALFGAFVAGLVMPAEWNFRKMLIDKIEDVALVLLLPLFFVYTGLRTQIGLLNYGSLWLACLWIVVVAVAGKLGGSAIAARITGETWTDSLSIGALMNTRGLVELIVLNIGYDLHILSPQVFTMMVLMALITTFMTSPLLDLINGLSKKSGHLVSRERNR